MPIEPLWPLFFTLITPASYPISGDFRGQYTYSQEALIEIGILSPETWHGSSILVLKFFRLIIKGGSNE